MRALLPLCLTLVVLGCGDPAGVPDLPADPPTLRTAVAPQATVVGQPFSFDASQGGSTFTDPSGRGLSYTLVIAGPNGGLTTTSARISGVPTVPGVVRATLTASDPEGRAASTEVAVAVFAAGLASPQVPAQPLRYGNLPLPLHFTAAGPGGAVAATDNTPANNAVTDAGATLGRVLFYDRRLSVNDGVSCASCHQQSTGFSDPARLSQGFGGGETDRHSMSLVNARFYQRGRFFWDERAPTLEAQVLQPIQDPVEMGMRLEDLVVKLRATPFYAPLFAAAFGSGDITSDRVARALAQFTRALVSSASRFDSAFAGGPQPNLGLLTPVEAEGFQVFTNPVLGGCVRCHATHAQVAGNVFNTGLDAMITDAGAGNGRFKTPSLRNVAVRGRFMHDGRFTTLHEVVNHYDNGVQDNPALDPGLRGPVGAPPRRLNLSQLQKDALVAFLHTLTDHQFLTDARFSDPFSH